MKKIFEIIKVAFLVTFMGCKEDNLIWYILMTPI